MKDKQTMFFNRFANIITIITWQTLIKGTIRLKRALLFLIFEYARSYRTKVDNTFTVFKDMNYFKSPYRRRIIGIHRILSYFR